MPASSKQIASVAMIVGGTGGIGSQIAADLRANGTRVATISRRPPPEPRPAELHVPCDVACAGDFARAVDEVRDTLGTPTVMIHCAGRSFPGGLRDTAAEHWRAGIDLLLTSVFLACKFTLPAMATVGGGAAVIISSAAGHRAVGDAITYATAKAALSHMVRCMAKELAPDNVRVNCLAPGFVDTRFHAGGDPQHLEHTARHRIPLRRFASPAEVSHMTLTLLANPYVTGQTVVLDGGLNLGA